MGGNLRVPRSFPVAVAILTAGVVLAAMATTAIAGDFSGSAVAVVMLLAGGVFLLLGAVISGALPLLNSLPGSDQGLNLANTMSTELLLQQSQRDPELRADTNRRRRLGFRLLASGALLVVIALVLA